MTDTSIIFTKDKPLTIGTDDFGSYGTIFAPDSDHEVPNPDESPTQLSMTEVDCRENRFLFRVWLGSILAA